MKTILVPAALAVMIVSARSVMDEQRIPYPYELLSVGIIYGAAGLIGNANDTLGSAVAWAYLVALILAPKQANILNLFASGLNAYSGQGQQKKGATA